MLYIDPKYTLPQRLVFYKIEKFCDTRGFGRFVDYVCLEILRCCNQSILIKFSDIFMYNMKIILWGLKGILLSGSRDVQTQNLE